MIFILLEENTLGSRRYNLKKSYDCIRELIKKKRKVGIVFFFFCFLKRPYIPYA